MQKLNLSYKIFEKKNLFSFMIDCDITLLSSLFGVNILENF